MPNWVKNIVKVSDVGEWEKRFFNEEGEFDFNKVIEMPPILGTLRSPTLILPLEEVKEWYKEQAKENAALDYHCLSAPITQRYHDWLMKKYNAADWYDWCRINWGTKWNACDSRIDRDKGLIWFDTAWSMPYHLYTKLAAKNPDLKATIFFADEDIGSNCGTAFIENGKVTGDFMKAGTDEAIEFAMSVWEGELLPELKDA